MINAAERACEFDTRYAGQTSRRVVSRRLRYFRTVRYVTRVAYKTLRILAEKEHACKEICKVRTDKKIGKPEAVRARANRRCNTW